MTTPAQSLVGRDRELELLERLLSQAREGTPRFAQVTGEPGIGKTYLLAELGRRADRDGWLVLTGRSSELEQELPFGLVIDTFDAYLASLDPRDFDRIAPGDLSELAGLFPSLRSLVPEPEHPTTPAERFRAHRAVLDMIERLAARQPLLLLLDDLHWSDGASIEQAGYTLSHPPQAAVMIVGSFRAGQADPALVTAVEAAAREGAVEHLELGPLDADNAEKLLGSAPGSERLYEQSGGNPFYLLQLARSDGGTGGTAIQRRDGDPDVPQAVSASIAGELDRLSDGARALADAAAVAGDPFELDLAVATAGVTEPEALDAVDELTARDLVRPTTVPRTFQFRHPLVRSAVYERCSPGARLAAHQRAAQALAARGAPAAARAHHVEHAARHGDSEAVAVLREAGEAAAGRAPTSAARWFQTAIRLLPEEAPGSDRLTLLMALAGAQAATGRLEDSRAALLECIELATDDGPVPRVRVIGACAAVEQLLGHHREAHQRLEAALERLPDRDSAEATALMLDLAVDAFWGSDYEGMRDWARQALESARALGDDALTVAAAATAAFGASCVGPVSEAEQHRSEAAALAASIPDDVLAQRLDAMQWLSAADFYLEKYADGLVHAERGLAVARATGQGELVPGLTQAIANILFTTGKPVEAGELLDEAVDAARLTDNTIGLAWSLLNRSYAAVIEGDLETALQTSEEAASLTEGGLGGVHAWAGAVRGASLLEAGQPERAVELLVARGGGEGADLIPGAWRANWLEWMTRCWLALDRVDEAQQAAARARARADSFGLSVATAAADGAEARVALAKGDATLAAEKAKSAVAHAEEIGAELEAAHGRLLAGQALAATGDAEAAGEELEQAAAAFEARGCTRYRDRAERELGKLGRRTHRRTRSGKAEGSGVDSLTGRELEIARLVVDRYTNPQIASELFLSVKTVETHMRNIFRKLDVGSRVEVARAVENADRSD
jgi:ATP/maltotriose-dependent transcriptional regulator MalT